MKVYLDTIGCRLNQAELESYARQFRAAGHTLVADPKEADLAVVNTCAVTSAAASDSRQKVRQIGRVGASQIVLTGCWATLQPAQAASLPGVGKVVPNSVKDWLVPEVLQLPPERFDLEPIERQPIPGRRGRTRAFVKVQDGCENRCTFCVTTLARGPGRSRPIPSVLSELRACGEAQEVVLTGVHLGSWGGDLEPGLGLRHLVQSILEETEVPRLRLSSLEPWDLEASFFQLWENPRLCRHLHLPLQSGCAATLKRMRRKTSPESFAELVEAARGAIPGLAITTDVITGFPGETQAEFDESLAFVETMRFAGGHVFTYSVRPGTAAARMPKQVPTAIRKERSARMRAVFEEASRAYRSAFLGEALLVLWESATALDSQGWEMSGLTDNSLRVTAQTPVSLWNQITRMRLSALTAEGLLGQIEQ
jgi:threonylcarbamoyladenosine tRNA methylthiotransferase MtaB